MATKSIYKLPPFDTGRFEEASLSMSGGNAELVISVIGIGELKIAFERVRWHEFTALYNCSADQIDSAYFELVELVGSESLKKYVENDQASVKAYSELHHFRIFLDGHGCHEVFAQSALAPDKS